MTLKKLIDPLSYAAFLRHRSLRRRFMRLGTNVQFDPLSTILTPEWVEMGDNVFLGEQAHLSGRITIGDNVMFGPRPMLLGGNHLFAIRGKSVRFLQPAEYENVEPIVIEREVWCGASVIILGNVTLGMGCVIGAGSVVPRSIPPYVIAVGNPCKPIARIFDDRALRQHLQELGLAAADADMLVQQRRDQLREARLTRIPVVDRTDKYRTA